MAILIGLTIQAESAHALYSPKLSKQVSIIRQHVQSSQAQNGTESILEEIEQIKAYDRARREEYKETGIAGGAKVAQELIYNTLNIFKAFDSLAMVFNYNVDNNEFISTCLRDEIWGLETLRDLVGAEMVKAYMLRDTYHGALLVEDYKYLTTHLDLLRRYGSKNDAFLVTDTTTKEPVAVTSTEFFFGDGAINYYKNNFSLISNEPGCPESEFEEVFKEVVSSAKTLSVLSSGKGVEWGNIWEMAEANARIRAREWIRANQLSLTIGGEEGGRVESLVKGGGWDKFVGNVKTQLNIAKNMVGPVTPLFELSKWVVIKTIEGVGIVDECVFYYKEDDVFNNCNKKQKQDYIKCQDDIEIAMDEGIRCDRFINTKQSLSVTDKLNKQIASILENKHTKEEVETAFIYSITMDSVAEQNLKQINQIMWDMNMQIKRGYEAVDKQAGEGIPTLFREIEDFADKQCAG